jgi:hypothetical protein
MRRRSLPAVQAAKARLPGRRSLGPDAFGVQGPAAVGKNGLPTGVGAEQAYKHRARDALGWADLRFTRRSAQARRRAGLRQASMSRGVEARGSEHFCLRTSRKLECAPDPWRPARPRHFSRAHGLSRRSPSGRRRTENGRRPARGRSRTRAMTHACFVNERVTALTCVNTSSRTAPIGDYVNCTDRFPSAFQQAGSS